jgi:hypothetical protein
MFQAVQTIQQSIQDVTGVNEAMTGTQGGGDMLVGVVEAQIQRGSLVQEPFYWALTSILKQAYEHMATVGKAVYHDNPRKLAMMVGDKGLQNIKITEDHLLQDYRIFIKRSESAEAGVNAGNQLLFTLLQAGLIDQTIFSNLFNRASPDLIARELRNYSRLKIQAQSMASDAQQKGVEQGLQQSANMQDQMMQQQQAAQEQQVAQQQMMHQQEMEKIAMKEGAKTGREEAKLNFEAMQNQQNVAPQE